MNKTNLQPNAKDGLYPPIQPYDVRTLPVGDGHRIYVEQCGFPQGVPVICLHGGPGAGCSPVMRRFFNPKHYRIILFDQRGCGKSTPRASIHANTASHLVYDIEQIRQTLAIDRCILFGGSWGAALALLYTQSFPNNVVHLVLRGVFLMTQKELNWFYGGGAGRFWPENWERFRSAIPIFEQDDLIDAYHKRLFSGDYLQEVEFARRWHEWEMSLCKMEGYPNNMQVGSEYSWTFSKLECHYFKNLAFLGRDRQILEDIRLMEHVPGHIVNGRYDVVCPPNSAWNLAKMWKNSQLDIVHAGHALSEPAIRDKLVSIMDSLYSIYS